MSYAACIPEYGTTFTPTTLQSLGLVSIDAAFPLRSCLNSATSGMVGLSNDCRRSATISLMDMPLLLHNSSLEWSFYLQTHSLLPNFMGFRASIRQIGESDPVKR